MAVVMTVARKRAEFSMIKKLLIGSIGAYGSVRVANFHDGDQIDF
jgi:hypothetical protein